MRSLELWLGPGIKDVQLFALAEAQLRLLAYKRKHYKRTRRKKSGR